MTVSSNHDHHAAGRPRRKGGILILAGVILMAAAGSLIGYNLWDSYRAGRASEQILQHLEIGSQTAEQLIPGTPMPTKIVDGNEYIGVIEIPSLKIKLPVMKEWSYAHLLISPCRYTGSYYDDDLVLCGHNYLSHFSPIKGIAIGKEVYFTNVNGLRIRYVVSNRETVRPTSVKQMVKNDENSETVSEWDLTLFTCNTGGQTRCAVRCIRQE